MEIKVTKLAKDLVNLFIAHFHEGIVSDELKKISFRLKQGMHTLPVVEKYLYSSVVMKRAVKHECFMRRENFFRMIDRFITDNSKTTHTAFTVKSIYAKYLDRMYQESHVIFTDFEVNLFKELIWMTYYIGTKNILFKEIDEDKLCKALLNCTDEYYDKIKMSAGKILRMYALNALSLKNSKHKLFPYPECCDLKDIAEVLVTNYPGDTHLRNLLREISFDQTDRFHYSNFVVEQLHDRIKEQS